MAKRDYYEILGVDRSADDAAIKKAFRKIAQKYHPDVSKEADAEDRFKEANEAYQVLSDPQKRRAYDQFGHAGVNMGNGNGFGGAGFPGFDEMMEDLFSAFTGRQRPGNGRGRRARQGRDLRYDLRLSFEQAVFGDELDINITRLENCDVCAGSGAEPGTQPITCKECQGSGQIRQMRQTFLGSMVTVTDCPTCGGSGQTVETPCKHCSGKGKLRKNRTLKVTIPAGVDDGTQIRLTGEGEPGEMGGPAGNLYVVLMVEPHEYFRRRGHDILLDININVAQAALGDTITIPTVDGEEKVKIEAGIQNGAVLTLKGKGFPKLRSDGKSVGRGDQLIVVNVVVPTKLTPEQRALFEQLSRSLGTEVVTSSNGKGFFERMANFFGVE